MKETEADITRAIEKAQHSLQVADMHLKLALLHPGFTANSSLLFACRELRSAMERAEEAHDLNSRGQV